MNNRTWEITKVNPHGIVRVYWFGNMDSLSKIWRLKHHAISLSGFFLAFFRAVMLFVTRQGKLGFLTGEKNRRDVCLCMSQPAELPLAFVLLVVLKEEVVVGILLDVELAHFVVEDLFEGVEVGTLLG